MKVLLSLLLLSSVSFAVVELSGSAGYDRQVFGDNRDNKYTQTTYSGSVAFYFWGLTAIEFNYYQDDDLVRYDEDRTVNGITILEQIDRTRTTVFGVGIRQAFATSKAFLQPVVSVGYAKQFRDSEVEYRTDNAGSEVVEVFSIEDSRQDSVFGSFTLRFRVTKRLTLNASVKTVFKYFETDEARDNVRYLAGFSWFL